MFENQVLNLIQWAQVIKDYYKEGNLLTELVDANNKEFLDYEDHLWVNNCKEDIDYD